MDAEKIYLECEQHSKEQLKSDVKYLNNVINILQQENQKYKEVIDKAIEYINKMFETGFYNDDYYLGHLNQILQDKEVE